MKWVEVGINTVSEGVDIISQVLLEVGIAGVAIEDQYLDDTEQAIVKGYLKDDNTLGEKLRYIYDRVHWLLRESDIEIGSGKVELRDVYEEDWAQSWKKYFKPIKVGERIVVKPTWESYVPKDQEIVIEIDPGMAFGTGTHETTTLCIQMLEKHIEANDTILDMGCGTGILAIASILLGADSVVAVDLDDKAVDIARENSKLNGVESKIEVVHGDLTSNISGKFDIVVSNIIADVIIKLSNEVGRFISKGGLFIASGIILDRLDEVRAALKDNGFVEMEYTILGEWAVVVSRYE